MKRSLFRALIQSIREAGSIERGEIQPSRCTVFYVDDHRPHARSKVTCPCGQRWEAVYPVETTQLECPGCHRMIPAPEKG